MITRQQKWAQRAIEKVKEMEGHDKKEEYMRFCKSFPAMIHNCGLCQSLAFAEAKTTGEHKYLQHLSDVMEMADITQRSREAGILEYQKLTRDALNAATWLKRYAEALLKGE